jgi:hypothetical protein
MTEWLGTRCGAALMHIGRKIPAIAIKHDEPTIDRLAVNMHGLFGGNP